MSKKKKNTNGAPKSALEKYSVVNENDQKSEAVYEAPLEETEDMEGDVRTTLSDDLEDVDLEEMEAVRRQLLGMKQENSSRKTKKQRLEKTGAKNSAEEDENTKDENQKEERPDKSLKLRRSDKAVKSEETGDDRKISIDWQKVMDFFKRVGVWIATHKAIDALALYVMFELVMILVACLLFKEPVVPICIMVIAAAAIGALMHNVEIWIHGVVLLVELIAGVLIGRLALMGICMILYVACILTLKFYYSERNKKHGRG